MKAEDGNIMNRKVSGASLKIGRSVVSSRSGTSKALSKVPIKKSKEKMSAMIFAKNHQSLYPVGSTRSQINNLFNGNLRHKDKER